MIAHSAPVEGHGGGVRGGVHVGSGRVAFVAEQLLRPNRGGIGTYTENLIRAYERLYGPTTLVTTHSFGQRRSLLDLDAMTHSTGGVVSKCRGIEHAVVSRLWERGLIRLRHCEAADVVHATSFHFPDVAQRRGRFGSTRVGPKLSVFIHDLAWREYPEFFSPRGVEFHDRGLRRAAFGR